MNLREDDGSFLKPRFEILLSTLLNIRMVIETTIIPCAHCGSDDLILFGFAPNGKQRYRCRACAKTCRKDPATRRTFAQRKQQDLVALLHAWSRPHLPS